MDSGIRIMNADDKDCVLEMMRVFYASPAVLSNGSEEIFANDIAGCISENPYLQGYIMEDSDQVQGYAMIAKGFSTEFGKPCVWIEDLYVKPQYRGKGIGSKVLKYITQQHPGCIFRLEVEKENERAIDVYKKCGFTELPYMQMKK